MDFNTENIIQVSCGLGMSRFIIDELESLGYSIVDSHNTGVRTKGTLQDAMRLNLYLRYANSVMILIKEFQCRSPQQLHEQIYDIAWEKIIPIEEYISVVGRVETPSIDNTMFANMKTKDAIVDRLIDKTGDRCDSGKERKGLVFQLYWKDDNAWLYLNTSGQKLSDRGYRKMPHSAPMRETLAAAVIHSTEYDGTVPLVNPMCGSGTLAIEAALIAAGRAPGLLRSNFAFTKLRGFDMTDWQVMRKKAQRAGQKHVKSYDIAPIIATDIDAAAITSARKNAATAGVEHLVSFEKCDFADTPIPEEKGIVIMNPEYGSRLGKSQELEATYNRIGDFFKQRCSGWVGYVFTGNSSLAKKVGLRTSKRMEFYNADIECRLLRYEMYSGSRKRKDE